MYVNFNSLTKRKLFSSYYQNVRDLRTKLNYLHHNVPLMNYDLLIFTETMFYDIIENDELGSYGHQVFRCDRKSCNKNCSLGGW